MPRRGIRSEKFRDIKYISTAQKLAKYVSSQPGYEDMIINVSKNENGYKLISGGHIDTGVRGELGSYVNGQPTPL
jgi:hypothetical protein